ncbi:hypothetical protein [Plastoroseomonas hellenica]|uniref:hypothetical protein n=1 Tax=Plastoroseomonas hellenica TaxID=2687306 RepID=UPI001BAC0884|nr:hypothetical protein [Plastoroseomonas hellenica]MBR0642921.1 hypothetical protein [Plastoroseomonas hellenica]
MNITPIEQLAAGGHLWRAKGRGGHVVLPRGTPFKVCEAGSGHRVLARGSIQVGGFQLTEHADDSRVLTSGNETVLRVKREVVSVNAFRYLHFKLGGEWRRAEDVREDSANHIDSDVLAILDEERHWLRSRRNGQIIRCHLTLTLVAAQRLARDPAGLRERVERFTQLQVWLMQKMSEIGIRL